MHDNRERDEILESSLYAKPVSKSGIYLPSHINVLHSLTINCCCTESYANPVHHFASFRPLIEELDYC